MWRRMPHLFFAVILFCCFYDFFLTTHVRTQCHGNVDTAVCLQIVFQKCNQHSGRCCHSVVECMCKIFFAFFVYDTDTQSSCLCIAQIGAAAHFKIFFLSGRPCFYIDRFYFQVCQITGATFQCTNGNVQRTEQIHGNCHNLSNHIGLSSGLQTTIISCFSN